jgi:hypothetical protein
MAILCVLLQAPLLPVTLYTVDTVGLITSNDPVAPVFQVYVPAPVALKLNCAPAHTVPGTEGLILILGTGTTLILSAVVPLHPALKP